MKKSTLILTILSSFGVVATAALAVKATPKAVAKIEEDSRANHEGNPDAYSNKEAFVSAWKYYIPAASMGAATIACVVSGNLMSVKQQTVISGAYALLDRSFKEYKGKLKELYGEEAHKNIMNSIHAEKAELHENYTQSAFGMPSTLSVNDSKKLETARTFFDSLSPEGRYFESTLSNVMDAEYHLNRNFVLGLPVSLNMFYEFLGIEKIPEGDSLGWNCDDGICWIDFNHTLETLDDGMEIVEIDTEFTPELGFDE